MLPDDDDYRAAKKLRAKEMILALFLAFLAVGASICYVIFLLPKLGGLVVGAMIVMEFLVMTVIYFILVSQMRKRSR